MRRIRDAQEANKKRLGGTNRGVRGHILSNTGSVSNLAVQLVLVDAVGGCGLADVAGTAGEHELVGDAVLFGVEQVRAMRGLVRDTVQAGHQIKGLTTRDRSGSEFGQRASNRHRQRESGWQTLWVRCE